MRISRRKRTDSGLVIPEWARRGWISLRQGGLSGPVDSRLDFRIDPRDEGEVSVLFTGQSVDGELFDEVTSDEFPLAAGIHGVVGLAWRGVPLFDGMHLGCRFKRKDLARRLEFSPSFASHEQRYIRFAWEVMFAEQLVVYRLPEAWWLRWFEQHPDLERPDLTKATALTTLRTSVDIDSIRRAVLEGNPDFPPTPWLWEVDLQPIIDQEWKDEEPYRTARPREPKPIDGLKAMVAQCRADLDRRDYGLKRYGGFVDELAERLGRFEAELRSGSSGDEIDQETMLLAVSFLEPPLESVVDHDLLLAWAKTFAGSQPRWWGSRAKFVTKGDGQDLLARLLGYWVLNNTRLVSEGSVLSTLAGRSWEWFGPALLVWLLGEEHDLALSGLIEGSESTRDLCRLICEMIHVRAAHADRDEDHQYVGRVAVEWQPYRRLLEVFPETVRDRDFEAKGRDQLPSFKELRSAFGFDKETSVEQMIEDFKEVKQVFTSVFQPLGLGVDDLQSARVLCYLLLLKARETMVPLPPKTRREEHRER